MKFWIRQHRILAYVNLGLLALAFLLWFVLVGPQQNTVNGLKTNVEATLKTLADTGMPTDRDALNDAKIKIDNELLKIRKNKETLMQDCTVLLVNRVMEEARTDQTSHFTDVASFVAGTGELHSRYRKEFKELQQKFLSWQIPLPKKEILGVYEDSLIDKDNHCTAWQLILKLWSVEAAVEMARESGLYIQPVSFTDGTMCITAGGIRAYTLGSGGDVTPWLIEVPVQLKVKGTAKQIRDFLAKTRNKATFMPLSGFEMRLACPNPPRIGQDGRLELVNYLATIEVCAFFPVEGTAKKIVSGKGASGNVPKTAAPAAGTAPAAAGAPAAEATPVAGAAPAAN